MNSPGNQNSFASNLTGPALIAFVCTLGFSFSENLMFEREAILDSGEYWRVVTGHFTHTNLVHLGLNLFALGVLWVLHGDYYQTSDFVFILVFSAVGTGAALLMFADLSWYSGLSGALHGLFVWGVVRDFSVNRYLAYLLTAGLVIKLSYEQWFPKESWMESLIAAPIATEAHLYGALTGLVIGAGYVINSKLSTREPT